MQLRAVGLTDVGRVRKKNEDSYLVDEKLGLFVVADGMGGHAGGEIASAEAIDQIHAMIRNARPQIEALRANATEDNVAAVRRAVEAAIQAATYMVFGIAEQDPARKGMGTTISCLLFVGPTAVVGQVGDSRVYLVRQGTPVQITEDHTLVNLQLKAGAITAEQAKTAPYQNLITRAVGVKDYVEVDTFPVECRPRDRFMLCSDGVHGYIETDAEIANMMNHDNLEVCGRALIDNALMRGGKDNCTVILTEVL
jgi:serine/threonine protein phosphatase PrpC